MSFTPNAAAETAPATETKASPEPPAATPRRPQVKAVGPLSPMRNRGEAPSEARAATRKYADQRSFPFPASPKEEAGSPPARTPEKRPSDPISCFRRSPDHPPFSSALFVALYSSATVFQNSSSGLMNASRFVWSSEFSATAHPLPQAEYAARNCSVGHQEGSRCPAFFRMLSFRID